MTFDPNSAPNPIVETIPPPGGGASGDEKVEVLESIEHPAKVMRIGSMIKQLLDEVHQAELDPPSRARMRDIYEISVHELADTLSPDLQEELSRLALPFSTEEPSDAELRVAQAQMAAQSQLEQMRRNSLPPGEREMPEVRSPGGGAYL